MAENSNIDVKKMPFERAIEELESIVKDLEGGKVPLEQSVALYERGEALKKRCEELLPKRGWKKLPWTPTAIRPAVNRLTWIERLRLRPEISGLLPNCPQWQFWCK